MLRSAVAGQSILETQIQAVTVANKTSLIKNSRVLLFFSEAHHGMCHVFTNEIIRFGVVVPVVGLF